ncbi:MAG TPA: hypothetical protein VGE37_12095, partial [Archangium sp.]
EISYADGTTERVDAPVDANGQYRACSSAANECPLWWLRVGAGGQPVTQDPTTAFRLAPGCIDDVTNGMPADAGSSTPCPRIRVENAGGTTAVRWRGALELSSGDSRIEIELSYVERPEGQWTGSMYYFGTFGDVGMTTPDGGSVQGWIDRPNKTQVDDVENGLIQVWGALRLGRLQGWQEFLAVLTATRTESWKFGEVKDRCRVLTNGSLTSACYPFTTPSGVQVFVNNQEAAPIPSGVSELPVAMNLRQAQGAPTVFEGRVESSMAMHYPGNPQLKLEFVGSPSDVNSCFMGGGTDCMVFLKGLSAVPVDTNRLVSTVGARTIPSNGTCPMGFTAVKVPWLVPGFDLNTTVDNMGQRWRTECRDNDLPFNVQSDAKLLKVNQGLSGGNPVPDGNPRRRTLRFIDGALVNQSELFILFEESYESFIPNQAPSRAYGYMRLKRSAADLDANAYTGRPLATATRTPITTGAKCSAAMLQKLVPEFGTSIDVSTMNSAQLQRLVNMAITGRSADSDYQCISSSYDPNFCPSTTPAVPTVNQIQYWCEDTGFFNGGPRDDGTANATKVACPAGSRVIFFNTGTNRTAAQMAAESCQTTLGSDGRATCYAQLELWRTNNSIVVEHEPVYRCTAANTALCDDNRLDLRAGKIFYRKATGPVKPNLVGLRALVDSAFRYKTRFRSTTGGSLGFAPRQCVANADSVPYCYDPKEMQEARERVDCLIEVYSRPGAVNGTLLGAGQEPRASLINYLQGNFASFPNPSPPPGQDPQAWRGEGFERLYAELLINQGDESLTSAYASRFDLAAAGGASFKGSAFEEGGIDLTGVAGAEMYQLYQAVQYYQLALDRLYMMGPNMRTALALGPVGNANNFLTPETLTTYLERLVRAASQKSRTWAEVAKRYQNFNRPDLARAVIERAYVGTYLESALISRLMLDILENSGASYRPQITITIEKAQRNYRMALLDMREVYQAITDEVNFFGYPADYIPFPALDSASSTSANAFESLLNLSKQRMDLAKQRELVALSSAKQGRVDAAQFQSDLTSVRNTYENQLAQVCGTFTGQDGRIYPSIRKYAHQSPIAMLMGDPCGRLGNGDIHNAMANVKDTELRLRGVLQRHANILEDIDIERNRVAAVCGLMNAQVDYQFNASSRTATLQQEMAEQRALTTFIVGSVSAVIESVGVLDCEIQCASSAAMAATVATAGIAAAGAQYATDLRIANAEKALKDFDASTVKTVAGFQCNPSPLPDGTTSTGGILQAESNARVANMLNDTLEVKLEALRAEYAVRVAVAEVGRMFNSAQRLQAQQEEAEQLSIDIQQAQNDPNVRIYQNDAVINADVSFNDALTTAYRATRVFEYYTSQSYAKKEQLFLIRMVTAGQYNLENYLLELENEFLNFEESFGNPDLRVMVLSLRDDILKIPYLKENGQPLDEDARINMLRTSLKDVKLLDARGYLTLPFSTVMKDLSPVTRNHKVQHVEIDLQGNRMGDSIARVYLRMAGTGVVRNVSDDLDYYVFPERLGVVNASILGSKIFDPEVYRNYRFRDRPLVNTLWELVINQRDELANKDIDLATLSDIRVLIYY